MRYVMLRYLSSANHIAAFVTTMMIYKQTNMAVMAQVAHTPKPTMGTS